MNKSLAEFITEQENGTNENTTNSVEKSYCECAAALSLAQCYAEQAVLMEYAESCGYDSLSIFTEAEEEKKENIFKRAAGGIKNAWKKFIEFIKRIIEKIKAWFRGKRVAAVESKISKLSPDTMITVDANFLYPAFVIAMADRLCRDLEDIKGVSTTLADRFKKDAAEIREIINGERGNISTILSEAGLTVNGLTIKEDGRVTLTIGQYKKIIASYKDENMEKKASAMLDQLSRIEKEHGDFIDKLGSGYDNEADEKEYGNSGAKAKAVVSAAMSEYMNAFTKLNEKAVTFMNNVTKDVDTMLKAANGDTNVKNEIGTGAKTESFYFV